VANSVLCDTALVWFTDDDPLWIKTWRNIQCDTVIQISKEQYCAFCWLNVANWLSTMHGMNNIKSECYEESLRESSRY
jgi:hypothetical protein